MRGYFIDFKLVQFFNLRLSLQPIAKSEYLFYLEDPTMNKSLFHEIYEGLMPARTFYLYLLDGSMFEHKRINGYKGEDLMKTLVSKIGIQSGSMTILYRNKEVHRYNELDYHPDGTIFTVVRNSTP